jgi:hypothetical protein
LGRGSRTLKSGDFARELLTVRLQLYKRGERVLDVLGGMQNRLAIERQGFGVRAPGPRNLACPSPKSWPALSSQGTAQ